MSSPHENPEFTASEDDPARAAEVSDSEYELLAGELETVVMPRLSRAGATLVIKWFRIVKLGRRGGLASLLVKSHIAPIEGWIYFQIHRVFGPLRSSERVFWMFSIRRGEVREEGKPGRLPDLSDESAVDAIIGEFVETLLAAQPQ